MENTTTIEKPDTQQTLKIITSTLQEIEIQERAYFCWEVKRVNPLLKFDTITGPLLRTGSFKLKYEHAKSFESILFQFGKPKLGVHSSFFNIEVTPDSIQCFGCQLSSAEIDIDHNTLYTFECKQIFYKSLLV